ncbi:MAG: zinc ribbon domain-containing protein [Candidatus Binatia bacterium]|nr:zinc ribbon domain-containing protein [Candidatus Binatia bacterium]
MPIYEYHCEKCGEFDVMQKITANPLRKCPTCKSKVKKLMSNTAFQLKGTGWYVTDYGNKGSTKSAENASKSSEGSSSDSSSSDSSPSDISSSDSSSSASSGSDTNSKKKSKGKGKGESAAA